MLAACNLPTAGSTASESASPVTTPALLVSAETSTLCRSGPGPAYEPLETLGAGRQAEAVGRSPQEDYWLIRNPSDPATLCWVDAQYVTLTGNADVLPVATPPATPSPIGLPSPVPGVPARWQRLPLPGSQRTDAGRLPANAGAISTLLV